MWLYLRCKVVSKCSTVPRTTIEHFAAGVRLWQDSSMAVYQYKQSRRDRDRRKLCRRMQALDLCTNAYESLSRGHRSANTLTTPTMLSNHHGPYNLLLWLLRPCNQLHRSVAVDYCTPEFDTDTNLDSVNRENKVYLFFKKLSSEFMIFGIIVIWKNYFQVFWKVIFGKIGASFDQIFQSFDIM